MWTEKEIERCGKYIDPDSKLEDFLDNEDLMAIKAQGTTYYNLRDAIFRPKVPII